MPTRRKKTPAALKAAEIAWAAPQVIALRSMRMLAAGPQPNARDRREFTVMGTEKVLAAQQAALGMAGQWAKAWQDAWLTGVRQSWSMALTPWTAWAPGGRGASRAGSRAGAAFGQLMSRTAQNVLDSGLTPVHARVTANAKRLSKPAAKRRR